MVGNFANLAVAAPADWHVQPPVLDGAGDLASFACRGSLDLFDHQATLQADYLI